MMKRFFAGLGIIWVALALPAQEVVNLWTGRQVEVAAQGKWELAAEHGRVLAAGNGDVVFQLPALAAGATVDAVLNVDGRKQNVRLWSPKPLTGLEQPQTDDRKLQKKLESLGVSSDPAPALSFLLPERRDFPLPVEKTWREISLYRAKIPGSLSVLLDKKEQILDIGGDFSYALLRDGKRVKAVFSPEFDFDAIENVLIVKSIIEENTKNIEP